MNTIVRMLNFEEAQNLCRFVGGYYDGEWALVQQLIKEKCRPGQILFTLRRLEDTYVLVASQDRTDVFEVHAPMNYTVTIPVEEGVKPAIAHGEYVEDLFVSTYSEAEPTTQICLKKVPGHDKYLSDWLSVSMNRLKELVDTPNQLDDIRSARVSVQLEGYLHNDGKDTVLTGSVFVKSVKRMFALVAPQSTNKIYDLNVSYRVHYNVVESQIVYSINTNEFS